jgi:hypothetical protein
MPRIPLASITVLASLGIVLGAARGALARSAAATTATQAPRSPTPRQARKAQRKADKEAAREKKSAELSKLEKNGYHRVEDRND